MCLNPKWIYKKGKYQENNYHGMKGEPYEIGTYSKCGHCQVCINEKCNNWVIRNIYEAKQHEKICFITLTYAENPYILVRKDLTDFIKRLRIKLDRTTGEKLRIYGCGEYGTINNRPHYHLLIYGWTDKNATYVNINKKHKIIYKSKLIEDTWGLGITSYQEFSSHEIPYISIYETPQEEFARAYKLTREKIKQLEGIYRNNRRIGAKRRKMLLDGLEAYRKEFDEKKTKYKLVREFNCWSIGLGWERFYEEYAQAEHYTFTEYIENKQFVTPSPWVKRLANMGDIPAIEEMKKREAEIKQSASEEEERLKNVIRVNRQRKKEILEWTQEKTMLEII